MRCIGVAAGSSSEAPTRILGGNAPVCSKGSVGHSSVDSACAGFDRVPERFKTRVALTKDAITGSNVLDMRALLTARLMGQCARRGIKDWLATTKVEHDLAGLSEFESGLLARLWPKADHAK